MSENKKNDTKQNRFSAAAVIVVIVIICIVAAALVFFRKPVSDEGEGNHIDSTAPVVSGTDDKSAQETGENESVEIVEDTGTAEIIKKADGI